MGRRDRFIERRKILGLTQESLAHAIEVSVSSIAQWERGSSSPTPRHRQGLAAMLQVGLHELDRLLDPNADPFDITGHLVPSHVEHALSLEQAAGEVHSYEPVSMPGLLQVRSYIEALMLCHYEFRTAEEVAARTGTRLARQIALTRAEHPLHMRTVIDESVLLRVTGSPQVMTEQLDHLLVMAARPNVEIHILPLTGAAHCAGFGSFWLLVKPGETNPFMVCTENATGAQYGEIGLMVDDHRKLFAHLREESLSCEASARRIAAAKESYR